MIRHIHAKTTRFLLALRVGFFLAVSDIRRSNPATTLLIIFIMTLTFLNLIVIRGVLIGLVEGSNTAYRKLYIGDDIIQPLHLKNYIENTPEVVRVVSGMPGLKAYTVRYTAGATLEDGYRNKLKTSDTTEHVPAQAVGIDVPQELAVTHLDHYLVKGQFITNDDVDSVDVGTGLLYKYTPVNLSTQPTLKTADVGSKVRLTINGYQHEVTIKGVVQTKVGTLDQRVYMPSQLLRKIIGRNDYNANEIAILLQNSNNDKAAEQYLLANGVGQNGTVSTFDEGVPKFVKDIEVTFGILSNIIGSISLAVAAITIFIVIFVNAITRRKYIGILKGIGVTSTSLEISYICQAAFYALIGISIGATIVLLFLKPFFLVHPIHFPFSEGILVAEPSAIIIRAVILFIATLIAGFIPARLVINQNTLDAILGR